MIYSISSQLYEEVAERLLDAINEKNYFSGTVEFTHRVEPEWVQLLGPEILCRLTLSCVVYRDRVLYPEGVAYPIAQVVPVWWEFSTQADGGELDNDFSFRELGLKNLL